MGADFLKSLNSLKSSFQGENFCPIIINIAEDGYNKTIDLLKRKAYK